MENWYIKNLEKLEIMVQNKNNIELNDVLIKIRKLKASKAASPNQIREKSTRDSNMIPFAYYSGISSSDNATSVNKTVNKAFICSETSEGSMGQSRGQKKGSNDNFTVT